MPLLYTTRLGRISAIALVASTLIAAAAIDGIQARTGSSSRQPRAGATINENQLQRRTRPVSCFTTEQIDLDGVLLEVEVDRIAIEALGRCRVTVKNSHIIARTAALTAGRASLTFENSIIEGTFQITQQSVISLRSSTIRGRIQGIQKGQIKDLGQNVWQ